MTTNNEPLSSIEARIEELHNTIAEKEEQIKARTRQLKDDIQTELDPVTVVRRHPFEIAGSVFVTGLLIGRSIKTMMRPSHKHPSNMAAASEQVSAKAPSPLGGLGIDILRSAKDLGFNYLTHYLDKTIK
ncbi:MAG: hypothetical protein HGA72_04060 [Chlorobiaceae bacterium]|jgi:hypothetical protein|nr:hypothetical protein [Chlorobiaceae bacterium]NTW62681.1 hypothetical protein [Chlorobiaceae bacterium]